MFGLDISHKYCGETSGFHTGLFGLDISHKCCGETSGFHTGLFGLAISHKCCGETSGFHTGFFLGGGREGRTFCVDCGKEELQHCLIFIESKWKLSMMAPHTYTHIYIALQHLWTGRDEVFAEWKFQASFCEEGKRHGWEVKALQTTKP